MITWLASYPKSGNTWMRLMLANYFSEHDVPHDINAPDVSNGIASLRWLFDTYLGVSSSDLTIEEARLIQPNLYLEQIARDPKPVWMKVHDAQHRVANGRWLFPPEASAAAIYILRNPLDVAVSNAFHAGHRDMVRAVAKLCDPRAEIGSVTDVQVPQYLGDWSAHVASWIDDSPIPVLTVRYEDMLADAGRELERVIRFARPEGNIDGAKITQAVANTAFEVLAAAEQTAGFRERPTSAARFFRSGRADDWKNHLTDELAEQVRARHLVMMQRFGYA